MESEERPVLVGYSYPKMEYGGHTYCGFLEDPWFMEMAGLLDPKTALPIECLWMICQCIRQCSNLEGDFSECGVDRGGSAKLIAEILKGGRQLHLFDTFSGMPEPDPEHDWHLRGDFSTTSLDEVMDFVGRDDNIRYHPGVIPHSFAWLGALSFSFVHLDLDLYRSTLDALNFFYPRMVRGGIIVLDDYARPTTQGVKDAVNEFLAIKPEFALPVLHTSQALVVKL